MAKKYRNFNELLNKMSPAQRAKLDEGVARMIREMPLAQLRAARELTQEHLARALGVKQSAISRMERRADVYVSTLASYVEAMGGRLEIRAVFPDGEPVIIDRLQIGAESEKTPRRKAG
jgi:DNA-binding XRE family transcriptional regulator